MKIRYLIILFVFFISACREGKEERPAKRKFETKEFTFYSKIMGEERNYTVFSPSESNLRKQNSPLPVLLILDGPNYFSFFNALVEQWSSKKEIVLPEMIVVSIKQNNRSSELLPSFINKKGNSETFLKHLEKELLPAVEANYNTLPFRTLFGHSRGGLFAINTLLEAPELFDNYIVSDPNLTVGNKAFFDKWNISKINLNNHNNCLFIGLADTKEGYTLDEVLETDSNTHPHMRTIWLLCKSIEEDTISNNNFKWKYYEGFGHNTVPTMVAMEGLLSVFDFYRLDKYGLIYSYLNGKISYEQLKQSIKNHFAKVSTKMGIKVYPYEELLFEYGEIFLEENMKNKAVDMFQWNLDNFPKSKKSIEALKNIYKQGLK
ncbi:alpha/beta hydrolase-fold protein [Gaetbulibacter sp. M240]|uniref:alpha/beta hydrolase-fold protein n=1 Tax=Gaetbulibacter sp. M240 TaxID=3126511 RepID=UPI00374FB146